ncbi:hypothetical protein CHS0354_036961 [Potamilus streckersoni]|uniref:Uncharacterized protein n=1 Tax=Potamilus streckersoni TaxID=2493646 RepID=A0AAE0WAR7_9BIVA|nr:hypothetical protein CHS0354_036961 [Potamilus streckersoni]
MAEDMSICASFHFKLEEKDWSLSDPDSATDSSNNTFPEDEICGANESDKDHLIKMIVTEDGRHKSHGLQKMKHLVEDEDY